MRRLLPIVMILALAGCGSQASEDKPAAPKGPLLSQIRVAVDAPATSPCQNDSANWTAAQKAYVRHLSKRMEIPVSLCPIASRTEAAQALAAGTVDLALLDASSIAPVRDKVRPILAQRIPADLGRVEVVIAAAKNSPLKTFRDAANVRLAMPSENSTVLAGVQRALAGVGINTAGAQLASDPPAALAELQAGRADALAMQSAQWTRLCRGEQKDDTPCENLRVIWRGREAAAEAWSVRRDIAPESWARLVGIHIALFQEQPDAAAWFAPKSTEIEPIEATGLENPAK